MLASSRTGHGTDVVHFALHFNSIAASAAASVTVARESCAGRRYQSCVDVEGTFLEASARARAHDTPLGVLRALLNELCLATQARAAVLGLTPSEYLSVGLNDFESAERLLEQPERLASRLAVSLSMRPDNTGTLLLLDKAFGQDFTDDDERLADLFAAQLALGVELTHTDED